MTDFLERYISLILTRRWLVIALAGPIMLAMTAGVQFITITNDYRSLFEDDNPQLLAFDALENTYAASNVALIAVAPETGSVFTREALNAHRGAQRGRLGRAPLHSGRLAHKLLP